MKRIQRSKGFKSTELTTICNLPKKRSSSLDDDDSCTQDEIENKTVKRQDKVKRSVDVYVERKQSRIRISFYNWLPRLFTFIYN